jgi:thymidylate synthase (FAD)
MPKPLFEYAPYDDAKVALLDYMGEDLEVVNSARISFAKCHEAMELGDEKLIHWLMKKRHGTPFEAVEFSFHVKAPIFVFREWQRHRISSFNEVSGRYVELERRAYMPKKEHIRHQVGKPGAYKYEPVDNVNTEQFVNGILTKAYETCYAAYDDLLALGIAKELARTVLPVGQYSEMRYKTNARSLMNFISLRTAPDALLEIRLLAECVELAFKEILPITWAAFVKNGRVAP